MRSFSNYCRLAVFVIFVLFGSNTYAEESKWIVRVSGLYSATASDESISVVTLPPPLGSGSTTLSVSPNPAGQK